MTTIGFIKEIKMYIRSQDRKELAEFNRLSVNCSNGIYYIHAPDVGPYHSIGDYKSKERCIAVLDEIQHSLEIGAIIFEMPKE